MKHICLIFSFVAIVSCSHIAKDKSDNITLKTRVIRTYDSTCYPYLYRDSTQHHMFDIVISLINHTNSQKSFWLMTCSRWENFIVNNDYIDIVPVGCDANFPYPFTLNINDSLIWKTKIIKFESTRYQTVRTTRFGLIFLDGTKYKRGDDFNEIMGNKFNHDRIIWSNPLFLNENK